MHPHPAQGLRGQCWGAGVTCLGFPPSKSHGFPTCSFIRLSQLFPVHLHNQSQDSLTSPHCFLSFLLDQLTHLTDPLANQDTVWTCGHYKSGNRSMQRPEAARTLSLVFTTFLLRKPNPLTMG